jgi:DNA-binding transcriptional LysR family regulator
VRLQQLRCLDAVARHGSVRRAAAELLLTPPSVAEHIASLEGELGLVLLERDARGSRLTASGAHLLPHLQRVLNAERGAREEALALRDLEVGSVRVVGVRVAFNDVLPVALGRFTSAHPSVRVEVAEALTDEALRSVADGAHDIAVVAHPGPVPVLPGTLVGQTLGTEPVVAAVPRRFVTSSRATVDWSNVPWVVLTPGTAMRAIFERHLAGVAASVLCEVADADTSRLLVEAGIGAALLPGGLCGILDRQRAVVAPSPGGADEVGIAVVVDGARTLSPAALAMHAQLVDPTASERWSRSDRAGRPRPEETR